MLITRARVAFKRIHSAHEARYQEECRWVAQFFEHRSRVDVGITKAVVEGHTNRICRRGFRFPKIKDRGLQRNNAIMTILEGMHLILKAADGNRVSVGPALGRHAVIHKNRNPQGALSDKPDTVPDRAFDPT